jgi:hypothetical protein
VPEYVARYCRRLDGQKLEWFFRQMTGAMDIVENADYLVYLRRWILKHGFVDLTYECYRYSCLDRETIHFAPTLKIGLLGALQERYDESPENFNRAVDDDFVNHMFVFEWRCENVITDSFWKYTDLSTHAKRRRAMADAIDLLEHIRTSEEASISPPAKCKTVRRLASVRIIKIIADAIGILSDSY